MLDFCSGTGTATDAVAGVLTGVVGVGCALLLLLPHVCAGVLTGVGCAFHPPRTCAAVELAGEVGFGVLEELLFAAPQVLPATEPPPPPLLFLLLVLGILTQVLGGGVLNLAPVPLADLYSPAVVGLLLLFPPWVFACCDVAKSGPRSKPSRRSAAVVGLMGMPESPTGACMPLP
jgi:hypothetical protein